MDVIMPQLGETVAEGKIGKWFKSVGDAVQAGDNLFEIETDKVAMEVQATTSGVLSEIRVGVGETVPVGAVVAVVAGQGEAPAKAAPAPAKPASAPSAPPKAAVAPAPRPVPVAAPVQHRNGTRTVMTPFNEVHTPLGQFGPAEAPQGLKVTPLARRLIKQQGLDIAAIARSVQQRGGWRIRAADVHAAPPAAARPAAPAVTVRAGDQVEVLNRIRAQTATHLANAWQTAPHVYQGVEVDFSAVDRARKAAKQSYADRHNVALTYLPFIARALCLTIAEFPRLNASFDRDRVVIHRDVNLGIAIDLNHEGLIVPVVHHAEEMTAGGLAKAMARQIDKARTGKLVPGDFEGGTYTITNNGSTGTLFTAPIINVPQVAILSTDAVRKRPVVIESDGGDSIAIRPIGILGQSFDHRAFDGAYAGSALRRLKDILETRDWASELA
jgi:pyruvate dehydrogenase E2 component (dihydrolipoamide acetyltransferase)